MVKMLWKPFAIIFIFSFLIINWNKIFPYFDYGVLSAEIGKVFAKKEIKAEENGIRVPEEGIIQISKIGVSAPIIFSQKVEEADKDLKKGVVLFPQSVFPGQKGLAILLGHSGPPGWPKVNYDTVFSRLDELSQGDEISVKISDKEYFFKVSKKLFFEKGADLPINLTNQKSVILLISCWPPGKNLKRIGVQAELID
ncbi:MAG: sortase [Candidatus Wildermuthbacteria bacterium]|nr:sortase [Candidatus Wildermuthbacteria bacterium]